MKEFDQYLASLQKRGLEETEHVLVADLGEKILEHWRNGERVASYPVSSGKRPRSCKENSFGTPWGLHLLAAKHGDGSPKGMVYVGREPTGECWQDISDPEVQARCLVTTRILRLRGLEPGLNAGPGIDTFDRYIYIHGSNHPERFPENISAGCIVMQDDDLIQLFDAIPVDSHVWLSLP